MAKLPEGDDLEKVCRKEGIDIQGDPITQSSSGRHRRASDAELQHRLIEARRARRESSLWLLAVISAIVSVISAITAILAVATH